MEDISLHLLDIAENAVRAGATTIAIEILEDKSKDLLSVCIKDDGSGMDEEMVKNAVDPFFTTKKERKTGLGLPLLSLAAQQTGGNLNIKSQKGSGTTITAIFKPSHPDMKPMGNIT
jgi:signal transduction histidine kinase